ncbi:MAG TPA: PadR family transcriptional regulator [Chloroflexota bacterium]|nr:PadR family transcriptional regulator [Chloroflexota bacterium]
MSNLSTTSYALLGQLALRPWNTYELAREIGRNLRYFWPRAESQIYTEARRLAERGLAQATRDRVGRRPRVTYSITPEGRAALLEWLDRRPRSITLEFEALLRVLLAPLGTKDQLLAAVEQARLDVEELVHAVRPRIGQEYLHGQAPFQHHAHVRAFVFDFLTDYGLLVERWAQRTRSEIEHWTDTTPDDREDRALRIIGAAMQRDRPA